ncbi:GntP family permease [Pseudomonas otitidis]|uniref:GntP family permease n=1 Tax=Metapseudomonas otitidis TaxID=319939 RepID=UPI002448D212|nr:GntP family permease [Pseudomonas otitidis]MDH1108885.1 GntP family permease [Pseudomonas otitidis]MDH1161236.1 GntP family permease [Pseudomonas otitidis]MDH1166414.1 GntP family permease [Pseudomonas otitidis]
MGTLGILLSLALLMFLAYRGYNVLILAPLMALLAVLFAGDAALMLPTYTQVFMKSLGGYLIQFFPLFLLGAIFGKLMDDSGSARAIAQGIVTRLGRERAILAIVLACGLLTYGGVSLFVVAFAVYPIGTALFREAGIPKRLLPGAIALGAFTFTMTALPGTPAIQNAIPSPFFGTDAFAAPILGLIGGLIMLGLGSWWLATQARTLMAAGEGYGSHKDDPTEQGGLPVTGFWLALLPILLVIVLNFLMAKLVLPNLDTSYLAKPEFGGLQDAKSVIGIWSIIVALGAAVLLLIGLHWRRWADLKQSLNDGTFGSMLPILNTASEVGYGTVIASLAGFVVIRDLVLSVPGNPLVSEAVAVNILAGITGSASGGMSIALKTLGAQYLEMANAAGISPELLHRVAAMASGCMDTLPHNGAVISLLAICKLTHRDSYRFIFMNTVIFPLAALVVVITLGSLFGSF